MLLKTVRNLLPLFNKTRSLFAWVGEVSGIRSPGPGGIEPGATNVETPNTKANSLKDCKF